MIRGAGHEAWDRARRMGAKRATLAHFIRRVEQAVHRPHTADVGALIQERRVHLHWRGISKPVLMQDGQGRQLRGERARRWRTVCTGG